MSSQFVHKNFKLFLQHKKRLDVSRKLVRVMTTYTIELDVIFSHIYNVFAKCQLLNAVWIVKSKTFRDLSIENKILNQFWQRIGLNVRFLVNIICKNLWNFLSSSSIHCYFHFIANLFYCTVVNTTKINWKNVQHLFCNARIQQSITIQWNLMNVFD